MHTLEYVVLGFKNVLLVKKGDKLSKDLRFDRVYILVDETGLVKKIPRAG